MHITQMSRIPRESEEGNVQTPQGRVVGRLAQPHGLGNGAVEERVAVEENVQKEPCHGCANERPPKRLK